MNKWLEVRNPDVELKLGHIKHVLIDFDGTISVIRQGWEGVMIPLMVEMICNGKPPTPEIQKEVEEYVDYSTGMLTIKQMEWLAEAVRRYGISETPKSPYEYKSIYNHRLLVRVNNRLAKLESEEINTDDLAIEGSRNFLEQLKRHKIVLYLASGTDHKDVLRESTALKINEYFDGGIFGALDHTETNDKEKIIQRILDQNNLHGNQLLVVGDGPVEIRNAKSRDAIALGVATNEARRHGLNHHKRERLIAAGADIIIPDFTDSKRLITYLFHE